MLVFRDPRTHALHAALFEDPVMPDLLWLATAPMREELARVLAYPHIAVRLAFHGLQAAQVLSQFDARARIVSVAPKAPATCKDPDDQKFIDLAVSHGATLLSKDKAVLCMRRRLMKLGVVEVGVEWRGLAFRVRVGLRSGFGVLDQ
ncbi:MAG: PIN domain-containing protein [Betaproteobacteria bacterium]|nr:PIN domain-containing protein [Betaproteobacteria bacterium]